jgi:hypothetical protein
MPEANGVTAAENKWIVVTGMESRTHELSHPQTALVHTRICADGCDQQAAVMAALAQYARQHISGAEEGTHVSRL